jgi:5-oxoprolinase (ATP-hydrolysing)
MALSFFIDRGGTFTDCLCVNTITKEEYVVKVLSENPGHYSDASLECVRVGLELALKRPFPRGKKLPNEYIEEIRIGTTIATNALLERQGNIFALIITEGFKDLLNIGQQSRHDIFDLKIETPSVLFEDSVEIKERVVLIADEDADVNLKDVIVTKSGQKIRIRTPLPRDDEIEKALAKIKNAGINCLAVAFMHSAVYPDHELRVGAIARRMGFEHVSLSHQAMPMVRIVARGNTACADAYLTPKIRVFVDSFLDGFENPEKTKVLFMRSDGGLEEARSFSGHRAILSGPAGGMNGFSRTSYDKEVLRPVVGFDMGGTS